RGARPGTPGVERRAASIRDRVLGRAARSHECGPGQRLLRRSYPGAAGAVADGRRTGAGGATEHARHHRRTPQLATALPRRQRHAARPPGQRPAPAMPGRSAPPGTRRETAMKPLSATLRLQFHSGFTLDHATELVGYFASLGISHIYASPLLTARPGSMHGYDVIDPTRINPELGGEPALRRLVEALRGEGMGLILDIVSNHMAVGGRGN